MSSYPIISIISKSKGPRALEPWSVPTNVIFLIILHYLLRPLRPSLTKLDFLPVKSGRGLKMYSAIEPAFKRFFGDYWDPKE